MLAKQIRKIKMTLPLYSLNQGIMIQKLLIPIILFLFQTSLLYSQKIDFTYDANGNRTSRIYAEQLQSSSVVFPVYNPKNLVPFTSEFAKEKVSDEKELEAGEVITLVYPNPTKGLIKIEISNPPLNSKNELRLYNLSGTELRVIRNFESYTEVDISSIKDGIYILRIKINESIFDWKIVKGQ